MGIVRGDQRDAVNGVDEHLDLAGLGVEALDGAGAAVAIEPADVGDDDAALAVHVDAVGRPAGVADAVERAIGKDFGGGAGLIGEPDAVVAGNHDIFRPLDAEADFAELVEGDGSEWHVGRLLDVVLVVLVVLAVGTGW